MMGDTTKNAAIYRSRIRANLSKTYHCVEMLQRALKLA